MNLISFVKNIFSTLERILNTAQVAMKTAEENNHLLKEIRESVNNQEAKTNKLEETVNQFKDFLTADLQSIAPEEQKSTVVEKQGDLFPEYQTESVYRRTNAVWTENESNILRNMYLEGKSDKEIASALGTHRSAKGVELRRKKLGLTSKQPSIDTSVSVSVESIEPNATETKSGNGKLSHNFWSPKEDRILRKNFNEGKSVDELCTILGRSRSSVTNRMSRLKLSIKVRNNKAKTTVR